MKREFLWIICLLLTGCNSVQSVQPAIIATPQRLEPIQSNAANSKSIFVSDITVKLVDRKVGQMTSGTLCLGGTDLIWVDRSGAATNAMREQIVRTLSKNGYGVYSGLIRSRGEKEADILVGVGIEDIKANICYSIRGMKGEASLTLRWEVVDNKLNKSFVTTSSGTASIQDFSSTGDPDVFIKAIDMATENFLAQDIFFEMTKK